MSSAHRTTDGASSEASSEASFTQSAQALEGVLERFKTETLPLEEALALFEDGIKHLKTCQNKLSKAKGRVEELLSTVQNDTNSGSLTANTQSFDA